MLGGRPPDNLGFRLVRHPTFIQSITDFTRRAAKEILAPYTTTAYMEQRYNRVNRVPKRYLFGVIDFASRCSCSAIVTSRGFAFLRFKTWRATMRSRQIIVVKVTAR